jgi:nucleoside-diphosphate-sugar epimerase
MRVMILGATGFIGPAVARRLLANGREPIAVSRSGQSTSPEVQALALDRGDPVAVARAVGAVRPDAVIDLLAMTLQTTAPLLEVLEGETSRYVMASSGDVYRQYACLHRLERAASRIPLPEDADLRARLHPYRADPPRPEGDPRAWMDDYDKIPIEQALALSNLSWSVVRLPMVFGPRDPQRRFAWAIGPMLSGAPQLRVDAGWAIWRSSYGYVDDVAEALALAAIHPAAAGKLFNAGPSVAISHLEWAKDFAEHIGWEGEVHTVPRDEMPDVLRRTFDGLDLSYPLVLDTNAIRATLGYDEVTPLSERLEATVRDERNR